MAFKMRSGKGTNFKDLGSSKSAFKQDDPTYAPGKEPVYGIDEYGDKFLKEEEDAIKPRNWKAREKRDEYHKKEIKGPYQERYKENFLIPDPNNPGSYIQDPSKVGWAFDKTGDYDKGYGGHIEHAKVNLADKGYKNIDVQMGHAAGPDSGPDYRKGKGKFRYETMTSDGSDKFTTRINTQREHSHRYNPYTTDFAGGKVQLSQAKPVEFNSATGKYEPVDITESGFGTSDINRLTSPNEKEIGGRKTIKGDVKHYAGGGKEKYVETDNKLKAVRIDPSGKRQVLKTITDDSGIVTDKSAGGWLNLKDRKRFVDGVEKKAWFGADAVEKIKKKKEQKKQQKEQENKEKQKQVKLQKPSPPGDKKKEKEKKKFNWFKKDPNKKKVKKPKVKKTKTKKNRGGGGKSPFMEEILGPKG